jgi:hypothetical protein
MGVLALLSGVMGSTRPQIGPKKRLESKIKPCFAGTPYSGRTGDGSEKRQKSKIKPIMAGTPFSQRAGDIRNDKEIRGKII